MHKTALTDINIYPEAAAQYLPDHTRTQVFAAGLLHATKELKKEEVNILYLGCGSLAPFMTPTAPLLPEARYTLVEISKNAAETAEVLIKDLGLPDQPDNQ